MQVKTKCQRIESRGALSWSIPFVEDFIPFPVIFLRLLTLFWWLSHRKTQKQWQKLRKFRLHVAQSGTQSGHRGSRRLYSCRRWGLRSRTSQINTQVCHSALRLNQNKRLLLRSGIVWMCSFGIWNPFRGQKPRKRLRRKSQSNLRTCARNTQQMLVHPSDLGSSLQYKHTRQRTPRQECILSLENQFHFSVKTHHPWPERQSRQLHRSRIPCQQLPGQLWAPSARKKQLWRPRMGQFAIKPWPSKSVQESQQCSARQSWPALKDSDRAYTTSYWMETS